MDDQRPSSSGSNAAARLRRSISAARAAEAVKADDSYASLGADDDDSSLVLYRDPSRISAQPSRGSVLSGAHEHGDTFFTALRKQPSWQSDTGSDFLSQAGSRAAVDLRCGDSQLNPVQSVSDGGFFSAAGGASEDGSDLREECGPERSKLDAQCTYVESSYASAGLAAEASTGLEGTPAGVTTCSGGQLTSSVLDIIDSLYGAQPAATAAMRLSQAWQQQLTSEDQPLRDMPVTPAAPGQSDAEAVQVSSEPAELSSEDTSSSSQAQELQEGQAQLQEGHVQDSEGANSHNKACNTSGSGQDDQQAMQQTPLSTDQASLADNTADVPQADDSSSSSADGQALLAAMDGMLEERGRLQLELGGYLQQLSSKADAEGQPLVLMSEDYNVLVERMLREGRAQQYRALDGWEGPHRFEDLPVAQLATSHKDPEIAAGLAAIAKLDEELREASLKALVTARALNPDQYAETEKRRLEKRAAELDAALAKERQRRSHAAKLRGVLNTLDEQCSEASLQSLLRGASSLSYYRLKPQEEQLLAAVLSRDDAALEADNPFDPALLNLDELEDSAYPTGPDQQGTSSLQLSACSETLQAKSGTASTHDAVTTSGASEGAAQGAAPAQAESERRASGSDSSGCVSRLGSCLSGSMWDLMRPSTALKGRRLSLAEIDAQLEALQADKELAQQLQTGQPGTRRASSKSSSSSSSKAPSRALSAQTSAASRAASGIPTSPAAATPSGIPTSPAAAAHPGGAALSRSLSSAGSRIPSAPGAHSSSSSSRRQSNQSAGGTSASSSDGAASAAAGRSQGGSHIGSTGGASTSSSSRRVSLATSNASGRSKSTSTVRTIDFIREQREARELLLRQSEVDAQLRTLQTSELPSKLLPEQLQALLQSAY